MVLSSINIPIKNLALILKINQLLNIFKTTINITKNLVVTKIMQDRKI